MYPIALYLDGVAFTRHDNILGVWVYNVLTGVRHLVAALRKSELCKCGCRGWCSLWGVFSFLDWSNVAMMEGKRPNARRDGSAFWVSDATRAGMASEHWGWKFALLFIKGDWMEFAVSLGVASWSSNADPCMLCKGDKSNWTNLDNFSALAGAHPPKLEADYQAACDACEFEVCLDRAQFLRVKAALEYDKRKAGVHGRALQLDVPSAGLARGDRLEPWHGLADVSKFDDLTPPVRVRVWRSSAETWARHRTPLFNAATGVSVGRCLQVDWLHTLSLGVFQEFLAFLFAHMMYVDNVWRVAGPPETILRVSVKRLEAELFSWYATEERAGRIHTRVQCLAAGMFGSRAAPKCKLHGAETNGVLTFSLALLNKYADQLSNRRR